jgi:hypothetical protein
MHTSWLYALIRLGAVLVVALALLVPAPIAHAADPIWRGEYFANQDLAGTPALVRSDNDINFNWGWGSPSPSIPVDHFSVRWTRSVSLGAGQWRFYAVVDDGIRLSVDGQTIIDQWRVTAPITYTSLIGLNAGDHTIRVEYWENTERAQIQVGWEYAGPTSAGAVAVASAGTWRGQYYANRKLKNDPSFERNDAAIYFDWGYGGPGGGVGGQDFSVRWTRSVFLPSGTYEFKVKADDGMRLWYDWTNLINEWHDHVDKTYSKQIEVSTGTHTLVVEYYQGAGPASIEVSWRNTAIDWLGNLFTCMRPQKSWIKIYRLAPNNQWEDTKPSGYGPSATDGELKLFGMPIDASYGWDGQPYKVELWAEGGMLRSEGDILAGQPALRLLPNQDLHTSWPCGANIP